MRITGESGDGFTWISTGSDAWLERAAHALVADGEVWIVEPVDFPGLDDRLSALGRPRGVLQLLPRHRRDGPKVAERLGIPLYENPYELRGSPFELVQVPGPRGWRETALWWPAGRTLVVPEAVGTARYFCAPGRPVGIHPLLRLLRPPEVLEQFAPEHLLVGHGAGLHDDVPTQLPLAIARSRRDLPATLPRIVTARRGPARFQGAPVGDSVGETSDPLEAS